MLGIEEGVVDNTKVDAAPGDELPIDVPPDAGTPGWWDDRFPKRRSITLNTAGLTLPIASIPALVRIPSTIRSELATGGADIRFVADDHVTILPHELDISDNEMVAWVKLSLTSTNQRIWLYYGNVLALPTSSGAAVFGTDYVSVHHLSDLSDATGHQHAGSGNANITNNGNSPLGRAASFNGNNASVVLAQSDTPYDFSTEMSVSLWIRAGAFTTGYEPFVTKGDTAWRVQRENETRNATFATGAGAMTDNTIAPVNIDNNAWHHIVAVREGTTKYLYIDSVLQAMHTGVGTSTQNDNAVVLGGNEQVASRQLEGYLDEVRISATPRSAAWVRAEYAMATANFSTIGAVETHP